MIEEIKMWAAHCDICRIQYELYDGVVALNEKTAISDDIKDAGEWIMTEDGKTYCSDCHFTSWDEDIDKNGVYTKDSQNNSAKFLGYEMD